MFLLKKIIPSLLLLGFGSGVLLSGCGLKKPVGTPEKVTIALTKTIQPVLISIAEVKGFFSEEGLNVTILLHSNGRAAIQSLVEGKADLATSGDTPIMFALLNGSKISVLTTTENSTKDTAIIARKDKGITSAAGLMGRRVGVPLGSNADYFLDSYLTLQGMTHKDVEVVDMKPEEMTYALLHGKVDAVSIWNPLNLSIRKELGDRGIKLQTTSAHLSGPLCQDKKGRGLRW